MSRADAEFVVLHHTGYGPDHYDFMIAVDAVGPLLTWRCPSWPITDPNDCQPLPPHRRIYLTYEGDVSDGRGRVRRVARGTLTVVQNASDRLSATLFGCHVMFRK